MRAVPINPLNHSSNYVYLDCSRAGGRAGSVREVSRAENLLRTSTVPSANTPSLPLHQQLRLQIFACQKLEQHCVP